MKKFNPIRLFVFFVAVIALSKFFEAGRLIAETQTFTYIGISIFSLLVFTIVLLVMGYWIYTEEKEKNNLKHEFKLYEWVYRKLSVHVIARNKATKQSPNVMGEVQK